MRRVLRPAGPAAVLGVCILTAAAGAAGETAGAKARLSPETFGHFRRVIRTDYEFRWRCLPWEINPALAAEKAAREGKPILCFGGHDGVPLGFE